MLRSTKNSNEDCQVQRITNECYMEAPSLLSDPQELPINIRMYLHKTWMGNRSAFNLTFPSPTWTSLKFRYQVSDNKNETLCRHFRLFNVSFPMSDDLMWDCVVFDGNKERNFTLTVITSEGKGGTYLFKAPESKGIDPIETTLEDWNVFFFLHVDHVGRSPFLPVTMQVAPFKNVTYNISLVKCADDDHHCSKWTSLSSILVNDSENSLLCEDGQCTVSLPVWGNAGKYAVTAQIVSSDCPSSGCFIAISPTYDIQQSQLGIWITIAFNFALVFALAFALTLHHRLKKNKNLLLGLKERKPTVLLIYLPENQLCLHLVNMVATFLKEVCYVHPYVIDSDVGNQDPNYWTSEHMIEVDRLLFLVPANPNGESVTPIRHHWAYALTYLTGHYFATHQAINKVAAVVFPFSVDVPHQIANVQRFKLGQDMSSLVTWLHCGTWMDCKFLWEPQVKSPCQKVVTYTLADINEAIRHASRETKCSNDFQIKGNVDEKSVLTSKKTEGRMALPSAKPVIENYTVRENLEKQNANMIGIIQKDSFDPDVPNIDRLPMLGEEASATISDNDSSDECSDELDDRAFL
nr:uncharacterized protein LOC123761398 isoform X2 [Procambarus clarkii]